MTNSDDNVSARSNFPSPEDVRREHMRQAVATYETDVDKERQLRLRRMKARISNDSNCQREGVAIHQLLRHVKIDPDGGILNLVEGASEQINKVPYLKKDMLETGLAVVAAIRTVANPLMMIYTSSHMLNNQLFSAYGLEHLRRELARLGIHELGGYVFIGANILEFFLAIGCVLLTMYRVCMIFYYKTGETPGLGWSPLSQGAENSDSVNPKYMYEATFWITDLPRLQNLSNLRLLALAHPNLLVKRRKYFSVENEVARAVLEGFFRCTGQFVNDDELCEKVAQLIMEHDPDNVDAERALTLDEGLLHWTPKGALSKLRACMAKRSQLDTERYNPQMLDKAWRVNLVFVVELLCFGSLMFICFTLGTVEFFHKICRVTLLLTDPTASRMTCITFFLLFLNQTLGMMHINSLLLWRVETFIFGGTDAVVSEEENHIMHAYFGLLIERVWDVKSLSTCQKLAVMLQLDDDDLQQLVVEESTAKAPVCASIRQSMYRKGRSSRWIFMMQNFVTK